MNNTCQPEHRTHGLRSRLRAGVDWFIPDHVRNGDPDVLRRARLVVTSAWTLIALATGYAAIVLSMNSLMNAAALAAAIAVALASLYVIRQTGSCLAAGNLLTVAFFGVLTFLACRLGGHGALTLPWYAAVPVVALSTAGRRSAFAWLIVTVLSLAVFYTLNYIGYTFPNDLAPFHYELLALLAGVGLVVLMLAIARLYEFFQDVMARRLRESEEKARAFIATSRDWIWEINLQGAHTYSNPAVEAILGYRPDEVIGEASLDLMHEDDRTIVEGMLPNWIAERRGWSHLQIRWRHKNGGYRCLESNAVPIVGTSGAMLGFRGVDRDITDLRRANDEMQREVSERRRAEESAAKRAVELERHTLELERSRRVAVGMMEDAEHSRRAAEAAQEQLRESEARLNEMSRIARVGGWEHDLITRKAIWTRGTYEIVEIEPGDPIPGPDEHLDYYLPEHRPVVAEALRALIEDDKPLEFEAPIRTTKGRVTWCRVIGRAIREEGVCTKVLGTIQDIDERKQAEEQLRIQSEALAAADNAIVITDRDGCIAWVNPAFTSLTGYTFDEAVGQNPRVLKSGKHDDAFYRDLWSTVLSGQVWRAELINRRKDGSLYYEEMTITPVKAVRGTITHFVAIKQDVSERKQAEEQATRFNRVLESSLNEIYIYDARTLRFIEVNLGARKNLGYSMDELRSLKALDLKPGFTAESFAELVQPLRTGAQEQVSVTTTHRRKDGSVYPVDVHLQLMNDGTPMFVSIVLDITERKRAETQLRAAKEAAESASESLRETVADLERFNQLAVGRELRMIELKQEVNELLVAQGQEPKFQIVEEEVTT